MAQDVMKTERDITSRYEDGEATRSRRVFSPLTDIYETENDVIVQAEMPGVASDGVDITLERSVLTIRGQCPGHAHEGYRRVYAEYGDGDFERVFTLSEDIDRDRIKAMQTNGVLTLVLPKAGPAKAKKIKVKAA